MTPAEHAHEGHWPGQCRPGCPAWDDLSLEQRAAQRTDRDMIDAAVEAMGATDETVEALTPDHRGRWQVVTQGSVHTFDLDAQTYQRRNADGRNTLEYDQTPLVFDPDLMLQWPKVGDVFVLTIPMGVRGEMIWAKHRISSVIQEIRRLP